MSANYANGVNGASRQNGNSQPGPTRIILDTDLAMGAGADIDDGFALALAFADPNIQLDMITTVNGNTDVESATILTGVLADRLGVPQTTPFYQGSSTPILRPDLKRVPAPHVSAMRAQGRAPKEGYAPVEIARHILANPGEITVVAIGPLTNIALAILLEPRVKSAIKELVIMGGVFFGTMYSFDKPGEFNVFCDPEAARVVLRSGIPQRWVGLDVTLQVRLSIPQAEELKRSTREFASLAGEASLKYIEHQATRFPGRPRPTSCPMHDPLAVAVVTKPELCQWRDLAVNIVVGDGISRGVMVCDRLELPDPPVPNCRVAVTVDNDGFQEHFLGLIESL